MSSRNHGSSIGILSHHIPFDIANNYLISLKLLKYYNIMSLASSLAATSSTNIISTANVFVKYSFYCSYHINASAM